MRAINNPLGAFGYSTSLDQNVTEFKTSAAVASKAVLAIGTDGRVATAATNGTATLVIGVATEAAASGKAVSVVTCGHVTAVPVDGTVAAGDVLKRSVTTAGRLAATATPGIGEAVAVALAASASNVATVWVCKTL